MTRKRVTFITLLVASAVSMAQNAIGADVTLAWDPSNSPSVAGYMISYGTQSGVYSQRYDVGNQTTHQVTQLVDGQVYYFIVQAYDATGTMSGPSAEVSNAPSTSSSNVPVASVALTPNKVAPQPVGTTVTWTAAGSGGVGPLQYKWWIYTGVGWTAVSGWTTSTTFAWTPTIASTAYQVGVWARSAWDTADAAEASVAKPFAISAASPAKVAGIAIAANMPSPQQLGTTIKWTATASGGAAPLQYKWWLYNGQTWVAVTGWTTSATFGWTPTTASTAYQMGVWARSAWDTADAAEASVAKPFAIAPRSTVRVTGVTLSPNLTAPQRVGTTVTWTAVASGGAAPLQYKWWVYNGAGWSPVSGWTTASTFAWTPTTANSSYVGIWVRSAWDTADAPEAYAVVPYAIRQ